MSLSKSHNLRVCNSITAYGDPCAIGVFFGLSVLAHHFGVGNVFDTIVRDVLEVNWLESIGAVNVFLGWR